MSELSGSRHARERLERWEDEQDQLGQTIREEMHPLRQAREMPDRFTRSDFD